MTANERRMAMYELIKHQKFITISELKKTFHVSEVTIRKDLDKLTPIGTLSRVFGGVTYSDENSSMIFQNDIPVFSTEQKNNSFQNKKSHVNIAKTACSIINKGDIIFLDSSSFSQQIAEQLIKKHISPFVFTNSLKIFDIIKHASDIRIALIGGEYDSKSNCFVGELTQFFFENIRITKAFFSANGFSIDTGAEAYPRSDLQVIRSAQKNALVTIVTAEKKHFTRRGNISLFPWHKIQYIITDQLPPDDIVYAIRSRNINLLYEFDDQGGDFE